MTWKIAILSLFFIFLKGSNAEYLTERLIRDLSRGPSLLVLPTVDPEVPLEVSTRLSLISILEVDTDKNQVEIVAWLSHQWISPSLQWNPEKYYNVTSIRLPLQALWSPDITLYNSAMRSEVLSPEIAVVGNDGNVIYVPSVRLRFLCDVSDVATPEGVVCVLKFGSWTYSGNLVTLTDPGIDLHNYMTSSKYELLEATSKKNIQFYPCCPEPYEDIKFGLHLRKRREKGVLSWLY